MKPWGRPSSSTGFRLWLLLVSLMTPGVRVGSSFDNRMTAVDNKSQRYGCSVETAHGKEAMAVLETKR